MRSATSYFNGTLYRKTMARFWPLWTAYGVIWLFCIPLNMLNSFFNRYYNTAPQARMLNQALQLPAYLEWGLYMAFFFAILCAMAVFGYLYNSRAACWTHALPMRREALFATQYLAGLSFLLLPQLAVGVLTAIIEVAFLPMSQWGSALSALLAFLLAQSGLCLFFFSFAAFCAMFTGHILALPAFYGILNFLAVIIYSLVDGLLMEFFYGYSGSPGAARVAAYLAPCVVLRDAALWSFEDGYASPTAVAAYAGVGVALALVSLYVYRRRHVETAGDVVAVAVVRPLFKYGVSFCAGLCLGIFTTAFFGWNDVMAFLIPCILVWAVAGYFAAEMLLKKSFRVLKAWKGAAAMTAVLLLLCLGCALDLFGVEGRVPNADQVEELTVLFKTGYPDDSGSSYAAFLTEPESIQKFIALHQAIVDDKARLDRDSKGFEGGEDHTRLQLIYTLKGGGELMRKYHSIPLYQEDANKEGSFTWLASQMLQDRALAAEAYNFEGALEDSRITGAWLSRLNGPDGEPFYESYFVDDYARELWDAVQRDFAEGTIGVRYLFDMDGERQANTYRTDLSFDITPIPDADGSMDAEAYSAISSTLTVTLTPQASHTLAVLEKTGVFDEGYSLAPQNRGVYGDTYPAAAN